MGGRRNERRGMRMGGKRRITGQGEEVRREGVGE